MAEGRHVRRLVALDAWPLALSVVLCLPLLVRSGHPLARDLVFVPRQPLTDASIGIGDGSPRAVPLDAVVSVLTHVVDGGVLARVLPLALAAAGWGAHRLAGNLGTAGRLAAGGFAVWNPFVVERLALGQWALLLAYAALPWLAVLAARWRRESDPRSLAGVTAWLGLASLTPTGGLLGAAVALTVGLRRTRRAWWLVGVCAVLQAPWVLPSVLGPALVASDPAGVDAFSAEAEGPGGVVVALLGLGGVWDSGSVPTTRESWWAPASAIVVLIAVAVAWRCLDRPTGGLRNRLAWPAAAGLALALLAHLPGGADLLRWLVATVPGAGLLRDGHKFLAPFAILVAIAVGVVVDRCARRLAGSVRELAVAAALLGAALPLALLPDGALKTWKTVDPVSYPAGFDQVEEALDAEPPGDVATLPWRSYRRFEWGHGLTSSDPALRWFDRGVVVSDDLQVGPTLVRGESQRARSLGVLLRDESVADSLREAHVGYALVYVDDPDYGQLDLSGLELLHSDADLALYRVPGVKAPSGPPAWRRVVVASVDVFVVALVLLGAGVGAARRRRATDPDR